jgi:hypothetical protein
VPYIAPWQTGFLRYSTQLYTMRATGTAAVGLTVPETQWWRIIFATAVFGTSATVGNRQGALEITSGGMTLLLQAGITQPAGALGSYTWGVGIGATAVAITAAAVSASNGIPDMLWPAASSIQVALFASKAGDAISTPAPTLAVEVYTEDYNSGALTPVLVPTPLLV